MIQVHSKKPNNRIQCRAKMTAAAIVISTASLLFIFKIFQSSTKVNLEAYRIKDNPINDELFDRSNNSTSSNSVGAGDTVLPDAQVSGDNIRNSTDPLFVLHIGPHKTATSVIQCDLSRYRKELYEKASVVYLGRVYSSCLKRSRNKHVVDPRSIIDSCFKNGNCKEKDVWERLESELAYLSAHKKHVIFSDEAFARMYITARNGKDNRELLYKLVNKYYPGRMRVVVVYRRYYEWQLSVWNEHNKPFINGNGDSSIYRSKYQNWPSEGGLRCNTFQTFMKRFMDFDEEHASDHYRNKAEANHVHVAEYFQGLWRNYSSEVQVLNLHEMNVPSDEGEDATSRFLRSTITPLAAKTYIRSKDSDFGGRHNPSRNINYDILAVAAYEKGLLSNQSIPRSKVAILLEENLMKKLNTKDLPLQCPSGEELELFLQRSLHYEELLYPNQTDLKEHETAFFEAVKKHKFCNFDFDKLVEDEAVQKFFTKEIPRLYKNSKLL